MGIGGILFVNDEGEYRSRSGDVQSLVRSVRDSLRNMYNNNMIGLDFPWYFG